jgi:hypothetical protein
MFKYIRVQIVHPCRAKCAWCATHRKNKLFQQLVDNGMSDRIHDFYVEVIQHLRPREVFISGGEPLLHPRIADFLNAIKDHTQLINLFTSYQWSVHSRKKMEFDRMPLDKIVFNHTPIYFEEEQWHALTGGFPFKVYLDNIRAFNELPARKRFKFIINHDNFGEELSLFQKLVEPDERCQLSLKVINDQGNGLMDNSMADTRELVNRRVAELDALTPEAGWGRVGRKEGSLDQMAPLLIDGDVSRCNFRREPIELRFALDRKVKHGKAVLKYRYCPYFPPSFGHRFHIGKDRLEKLETNFEKGSYRRQCHGCRFLKYYRGKAQCTAAAAASEGKTAASAGGR